MLGGFGVSKDYAQALAMFSHAANMVREGFRRHCAAADVNFAAGSFARAVQRGHDAFEWVRHSKELPIGCDLPQGERDGHVLSMLFAFC
jgi:hypothetical protein